MGSLIFTQWYYHSQCFKAVSPASQCHQRFLTAGSPGPSSNETDWCLIRKTGCTVPEDITETGMLMGCLLIVALIKFREFKRRLLFGPQLLIEGSSPETHKWELNDWWTARKMTYVLFIFNLSLYRSYQYFSFTNLNIFLQIVFGIPKRITEKSPKNRYLFSFIIDFDLVLLNSKAPLSLDIRQQNKPCQSSDEPISIHWDLFTCSQALKPNPLSHVQIVENVFFLPCSDKRICLLTGFVKIIPMTLPSVKSSSE